MKNLRFKEARKLEKQFACKRKNSTKKFIYFENCGVCFDNKNRINLFKSIRIPKAWKTLLLDTFNYEIFSICKIAGNRYFKKNINNTFYNLYFIFFNFSMKFV